MSSGSDMSQNVTILKPSTAMSIGLLAAIIVPAIAMFAWIESTYVRKDLHSVQMATISQALQEIKANVRELKR